MSLTLSAEFYGQFFLHIAKLSDMQARLHQLRDENLREDLGQEIAIAMTEFREHISGLTVESYEDLVLKTESIVKMGSGGQCRYEDSLALGILRDTYVEASATKHRNWWDV